MILPRTLWLPLLALCVGCAAPPTASSAASQQSAGDFGVLVMAHGGGSSWNNGVMSALAPLHDQYTIEVAFGMADAVSIQDAVHRLEARGVDRIGVVRLFISGESWYERTEKILGVREGAPERPQMEAMPMSAMQMKGMPMAGHSMEFWRVQTEASFALSTQGLAEAHEMGAVLADRAKALSHNPRNEDVLILAHGPGDDLENERWIANIRSRASSIGEKLPFRRVQVETLREDWPEKRVAAEQRIRAFVIRAQEEGGTAIVIPFRVNGFGPYANVLMGLDYVSGGQGLIPHQNVTQWIARQISGLQSEPFRTVLD